MEEETERNFTEIRRAIETAGDRIAEQLGNAITGQLEETIKTVLSTHTIVEQPEVIEQLVQNENVLDNNNDVVVEQVNTKLEQKITRPRGKRSKLLKWFLSNRYDASGKSFYYRIRSDDLNVADIVSEIPDSVNVSESSLDKTIVDIKDGKYDGWVREQVEELELNINDVMFTSGQ